MARARCRGDDVDPDLWFPDIKDGGPHGYMRAQRRAIEICAQCPVVPECREYVLQIERTVPLGDTRHGIWGGLPGTQRAEIERARRASAAARTPR